MLNKRISIKWHLLPLVVLQKPDMQRDSVEPLHNNRNPLKQKKNISRMSPDAADFRLPRSVIIIIIIIIIKGSTW